MYIYTWYQWLLFFFIYCFIGWIIESTYVSLKCGHFVNRGFLRLPLLPLYGSLFKMKYWDYTNNPFNINGYICLGTSIAWGFLTIVLTEFIHRPVETVVLDLNPIVCIVLCGIIGALFVADTVESTKEALDLGRVLESMTKMKAELEEIQVQIALLKAETADKLSDLRDEQIQRAANLKGEAAVKITILKAETAMRTEETINALKESAERGLEAASLFKETAGKAVPDLSSLSERLQSLTENRDKLSKHLGFYRKGLLRGNPTASSRQFGEALKELKERLKN